jgi:hypothetical protein
MAQGMGYGEKEQGKKKVYGVGYGGNGFRLAQGAEQLISDS